MLYVYSCSAVQFSYVSEFLSTAETLQCQIELIGYMGGWVGDNRKRFFHQTVSDEVQQI